MPAMISLINEDVATVTRHKNPEVYPRTEEDKTKGDGWKKKFTERYPCKSCFV